MNRSLLLVFIVTLLVGVALAKRGSKPSKGKPGKQHSGMGNAPAATETGGDWTWGECVPRKGDCGRGVKTGACSGTNCTLETAEKPCRVPCPETETAPATEPEAQDTDAATATGEELTTEPPRRGGKGKGGKKPAKTGGKGNKGGRGGRPKPGKPGRGKIEPGTNCTYGRPVLSECDPETNRQNRTRTLVSGDPALCQEAIIGQGRCDRAEVRHENKRCDYVIGEFGDCDLTTKRRQRVDTLSDPSQTSEGCRPERTVQDRCSQKDCMYNWALSDCDAETNTVAMTGSLVNVEGAPSHCEVAVSRELACKDGKARCRLGEWGEFSECADGIQTRTRTVNKGGKACEKLTKEHMTC